jgi:hypothetical protein
VGKLWGNVDNSLKNHIHKAWYMISIQQIVAFIMLLIVILNYGQDIRHEKGCLLGNGGGEEGSSTNHVNDKPG